MISIKMLINGKDRTIYFTTPLDIFNLFLFSARRCIVSPITTNIHANSYTYDKSNNVFQ